MVIEISLTRKLCDKLGLTLLPLENDCPKEDHFYADIITKDRQQNIMFFNTLFSWISISKVKDFKKCPLQEFKASIYETLLLEGIKPYIARSYLDDISDIRLSLTNNKSIVARLSTAKKNIHFFYDRYYNVPDVLTLSRYEFFNDTFYKNPLSKKGDSYISPYEEMGYYLLSNYYDKEIEEDDKSLYYQYKDKVKDKLPPLMDFSKMSDEEIDRYSKGINRNHYYYTSSHFVKGLYEKYPQPAMEDHFEYIISHLSLKDINNDERYSCYLRFFNLDKKLFFIYYNQFGRKYISRL